MSERQLVYLYECGHRELSGRFGIGRHADIPLGCAGPCKQCEADGIEVTAEMRGRSNAAYESAVRRAMGDDFADRFSALVDGLKPGSD